MNGYYYIDYQSQAIIVNAANELIFVPFLFQIYAIRIHFMKYGSQYGALGAMLKEMESQD